MRILVAVKLEAGFGTSELYSLSRTPFMLGIKNANISCGQYPLTGGGIRLYVSF